MRIEGLRISVGAEGHELSAAVGGLRLWFRLPEECPPGERVDPFVPGALLAAMASGEALEVSPETPVSARLLQGVDRAQEIIHAWNPDLKKVQVRAARAAAPPQRREVASLFSGGVDSLFTVGKHRDEISRLILVKGLEISLSNDSLFDQTVRLARRFADETGRTVVPIQTNLRELGDAHRLDIHLFHGALLAGAALAASHVRTYFPSSWTYAHLVPWGTHALLDSLWSTEACEFVHDGAEAERTEKVAALARSDAALRVLRVCFSDTGAYNCGRCEKCLRTMVTLHLLGLKAATFPPLPPTRVLRRSPVDPGATDLVANIELADRVGNREIAGALKACLRRYRLLSLVREADALVLGGLMRRSYRSLRRAPPEPALIGCVPGPECGPPASRPRPRPGPAAPSGLAGAV